MIQLVATIAGILFGAVGMLIAVQQHIATLRREWKKQLEEEKQRHAEANVKSYAAQRDFEHLERHLGQHKEAIKLLQEEVEEMREKQVEMKTLLTASYNQIQLIAQNLSGGMSSGWRKE